MTRQFPDSPLWLLGGKGFQDLKCTTSGSQRLCHDTLLPSYPEEEERPSDRQPCLKAFLRPLDKRTQTTDIFPSSGSDCYTSFGKGVFLFVLSILSTIVVVNTSVQTYWTEEKLSDRHLPSRSTSVVISRICTVASLQKIEKHSLSSPSK